MTSSVRLIEGLRALNGTLDLIICDLWGVMHDGITAHKDAIDALACARSAGIITVFLSNAPRPRAHVRDMLIEMGMPAAQTNYIVTSGGLARDTVRARFDGAALYHLGPETDHNTIEGLPIRLVDSPEKADVILATGLAFADVERHRALLQDACQRNIPFLCANPDRIVHVGEKLFLCAGAVADLYSTMGGTVEWFGKPTATALRACITACGMNQDTVSSDRVIMIGDSLQTDVAGAHAAGFKSLFIAGGIHRNDWSTVTAQLSGQQISVADFRDIFGKGKPVPDFMLETLKW